MKTKVQRSRISMKIDPKWLKDMDETAALLDVERMDLLKIAYYEWCEHHKTKEGYLVKIQSA